MVLFLGFEDCIFFCKSMKYDNQLLPGITVTIYRLSILPMWSCEQIAWGIGLGGGIRTGQFLGAMDPPAAKTSSAVTLTVAGIFTLIES